MKDDTNKKPQTEDSFVKKALKGIGRFILKLILWSLIDEIREIIKTLGPLDHYSNSLLVSS